ncbi:MAG TPA: sodium:proton antiporter [Opitutaceae bacterium]|nr:sodium:proton antiporter [Opitutaceae bacterium]
MIHPGVLAEVSAGSDVPALLLVPFGLLLLLIATMPLTPPALKGLWDRYYHFASLALGAVVAVYYLAQVPDGAAALGQTLGDYFSFIVLVGSLFVIAGGIHFKVKGEATPLANLVFLALGAAAANVIGTTGASMVLIRPWIRMNKIRVSGYHVVFFIFVVSNVGGALTPVGDPPLFLGYLRGVPFFWLIDHVMLPWLGMLGAVLAAFYFFDRRSYRRMPARIQHDIEAHAETWRLDGAINVLFLFAVIGAVFLPDRYFIRQGAMLAAALASWRLTPRVAHEENHFSFGPIKEVAWLFCGIFLTMLPALGYLERHGQELGFNRPLDYYFASGALSSFLDNAPTYANFFQLAQATAAAHAPSAFAAVGTDPAAATRLLLDQQPLFVIGVSLGSVFFGAMTYIGNGPNFMVKSIAESAGVSCPTFFGYMLKYSLPVLLPILALGGWLFLGTGGR